LENACFFTRQCGAPGALANDGPDNKQGEHCVAANPSDVKVSYNSSDKKWHASMNASADQLKAAPEFKYTGRWEAKRT
jgi:hypothetical protein